MSNFLELNSDHLDNNLKIVKNEFEDEISKVLGGGSRPEQIPKRDFKIVTPSPGMCVKAFKSNTNEKFFMNFCQTDAIPPPEDITQSQLDEILSSDEPSAFRIPMSITEPRLTNDNKGNKVDVCDIAVNTAFLKKCEKVEYFRNFLIAIVIGALSEKYNIQVKPDNWILLNKRKSMGTLISHRVENRDVRMVYDTYKTLTNEQKLLLEQMEINASNRAKPLIEEIKANDGNQYNNKYVEQLEDATLTGLMIPEFKLLAEFNGKLVKEILAEFHLPKCVSTDGINVEIGEDRIRLSSFKYNYAFDKFVDYCLDQDRAQSQFNATTRMLKISIPVISTRL